MTRTTILAIVVTAFTAFISGWALHRTQPEASSPIINTSAASIKPAAEPDVVTVTDTFSAAPAASGEIRGRFYLDGTKCAGYNFISDDLVLQYKESACPHPDTFRMHRISATVFYLRDVKQISENSSPRVSIYAIKYYNGRRLVLRWYNTSWTNGTDEDEFFHSEAVH